MADSPQDFTRRSIIKSAVAVGAAAAVSKLSGCSEVAVAVDGPASPAEAERFLGSYNPEMQRLATTWQQADWIAKTDASDAHSAAAVAAKGKLDAFVGEPARMNEISRLRERAWALDPTSARQLDRAWMAAAHAPGTIPDLVRQRAAAEAKQSQTQDGFTYTLALPGQPPRPANANDLDEILTKSTALDARLAAWTASKEIGVPLKPGLVELQRLRNAVARELKFNSYFNLEVADYGIGVTDLMALMRTVLEQSRPLFEQLHCFAKHQLAKRYGQPPPRRIPAHWLPNRWGQEWPGLVDAVDLDPLFRDKTSDWIVRQAERFYVSMGFPSLPASFWAKSDLYELPKDATRKKNSHASAWHIDLDHDVRSLMSVKPNHMWFTTTHHELGHIYYFLAYSTPGVPILLREGANRAFHEAVGDLISLASRQRPYLGEIGLLPASFSVDPTQWLLAEAMDGNAVFLPFSCGTMTGFEHALYEENLPAGQFNAKWWELAGRCQGIEPPAPRGEEYCDAATKTHINDDAAGYYDYAIGTLIVYQLHDYIARKILKQDPRSCSYYDRQDVGEYLRALLRLGATRDWRTVLKDFTGEDLSARAMMDYYAPLMEYLKQQNAGRDVSFA